jgi:large subunit ribosomal protein L34e
MVRPGLRSRSVKRLFRKVPGGRSRIIYRRRKHYIARDPLTLEELSGVPKNIKLIRRGAKTLKRPERIYGGVLSPETLAMSLKLAIRKFI